jgi:hypothetical protein
VLASTVAYDSAAVAWMRYASSASAAGRSEARFKIAEARFQAWRLESTQVRATTARQAIDAYLANAPKGSRRKQAEAWKRSLSQ